MLRVEVTLNDGTHTFKPMLLKPSEIVLDVVMSKAGNKLKKKCKKGMSVLYTMEGERIDDVSVLVNGMKIVLDVLGKEFVVMKTKNVGKKKQDKKDMMIEMNEQSIMVSKRKFKFRELPVGVSEIEETVFFVGSVRDVLEGEDDFVYCFVDKEAFDLFEEKKNRFHEELKLKNLFCERRNSDRTVVEEDILGIVEELYALEEEYIDRRICIICTDGLSLSCTILVIYLMKTRNLSFKESFNLVRSSREGVCVDEYIYTLLSIEENLFSSISFTWDLISQKKSIEKWLIANHSPSLEYTHLFWDISLKKNYAIPKYKLDEFISNYSAEVLQNDVAVAEILGNDRYKLFIDIDAKTAKETDYLEEEILKYFLDQVTDFTNSYFKKNYTFSVSMSSDLFHVFSDNNVNWKYGFHVIFQDILVNHKENQDYLNEMINFFSVQENPILDNLKRYNEIEELIDRDVLLQQFPCVRMLYSKKLLSCKNCMKKKGKKNKRNTPVCKFCNGKGKLPYRIHKYIGTFDQDTILQDSNTEISSLSQIISNVKKTSIIDHEYGIESALELYRNILRYENNDNDEFKVLEVIEFSDVSLEYSKSIMESELERLRTKISPPTLNVIQFLENNSERDLQKMDIKIRKHETYPNLIQLSYNSIKSNMNEDIVQECRGIIIDKNDDLKVISFPYTKFFNLGDPRCTELNWDEIVLTEKLDGSIANLYYYDNHWNVSSSSLPDGSQNFCQGKTFSEYFWAVWNDLSYSLPMDTNCTYMFELMSVENVIVVIHQTDMISLHGVRDNISFMELDCPTVAIAHGWNYSPVFKFTSLDDTKKSLEHLKPLEHEGYVIRDNRFNRCKLKSKQYVGVSLLRINGNEDVNMKNLLEIIRINEQDEFLIHFPEFTESYFEVKEKYIQLIDELTGCKRNNTPPTNKKLIEIYNSLNSTNSVIDDIRSYDLDRLYAIIK